MLENQHVSRRFIQRLAEGVRRGRLVEPILAARPSTVMISAPAGYGKTALAAQIATSDVFRDFVWIGGSAASSLKDALARLAESLGGSDIRGEEVDVPDLAQACASELAAMPDEYPVAVVIDDARWVDDLATWSILPSVIAEAPAGSVLILSTRNVQSDDSDSAGIWHVRAPQLLLTNDEIRSLWQRYACRAVDDADLGAVVESSGRHAALLSLLARHAALSGRESAGAKADASVLSLLQLLVSQQLNDSQRAVLDCAAVLGEGTSAELASVGNVPLEAIEESLTRIAFVVPLVSVSGGRGRMRFSVHALVADSCGSLQALLQRSPDLVRRVVKTMVAAGSMSKALSTVVGCGVPDLLVELAREHCIDLLRGVPAGELRSALDSLPPAQAAAEASLLLIHAELEIARDNPSDALQQITLAIRLGEFSGEKGIMPEARIVAARTRMALTDCEGAIREIEPLLDQGLGSDPVHLSEALTVALTAYALLGDRVGLEHSRAVASRLMVSGKLNQPQVARLKIAAGIVAQILDGDPQVAVAKSTQAVELSGPSAHARLAALLNLGASAIEVGDLDLASKAHQQALDISREGWTQTAELLIGPAAAVIAAIQGLPADVEGEHDKAASAFELSGEAFSAAATCSMGACASTALGNPRYAHRLSGRGVRIAVATGSPVLVWLAELVHAQASLALGDMGQAKETAQRILPQVESIGAMDHVLHARMILAQAALHDGDLATAVQHLSSVADHIVDKSPALTVASYLRAFPGMLGPLALAMGVDRIPVRVLNLVTGDYATAALEQAAAVLTPAEVRRLSHRMAKEAARAAASEESPEPEKLTCSVRLFGGLEVVTPRGVVGDRDWGKRKARLLFAMLVSRFGTDIPRGEIVEYLWPDMDEERALNNFYVVWSAMKRAVSPESVRESGSPFVEHARGVCRIVPGRVVSDLDLFTEQVAHARRAREAGDAAGELAALRTVAEIYRGEVLPGDVYDDWFAPLRERFRHEFEDAMLRAAQILENRGEPREGLSLLRRATAHDPWREDLYQATLRLQLVSGQRSAAIETYMTCRARLVDDLGIDPSRETTALYEQVLGMEERSEY